MAILVRQTRSVIKRHIEIGDTNAALLLAELQKKNLLTSKDIYFDNFIS